MTFNLFSFFLFLKPPLLQTIITRLYSTALMAGQHWMAFLLEMRKKSISFPCSTGFERSILLKYWVFAVWGIISICWLACCRKIILQIKR